ncbi:MAG TPA: bacillithiol biosynthesis deacetylase BshB1 [Myxococcales bacterium LLY-WYZ-16_1]|nr:bacillithiol biosynthesis deacetylase BshB1 [Myxococcales bacterium LLY-WYZ-16_1]
MSEPVDVLAVAPHPDDAELFCGGTLALLARRGARVGLLDLTRGEAASRGTPEIRAREAAQAAEVLGLCFRRNLGLPDGALAVTESAVRRVVEVIRRCRPDWVLGPPRVARHPDHEVAGELVRRAVVLAAVGGLRVDEDLPRHSVPHYGTYVMRHLQTPSFVVDISSVARVKTQALACHASQFDSEGPTTVAGHPAALEALRARDAFYGATVGVQAAEPVVVERTLATSDPLGLLRSQPRAPAFWFLEGAAR